MRKAVWTLVCLFALSGVTFAQTAKPRTPPSGMPPAGTDRPAPPTGAKPGDRPAPPTGTTPGARPAPGKRPAPPSTGARPPAKPRGGRG
jgi:hypothetical protein